MKFLLFILLFPLVIIAQNNKSYNSEKQNLNLEYLVRKPKVNTEKSPVLILLHGYGSNEKDLFSFSTKIPDNWLVVSVRAPFSISSNQFKWYDVKLVNGKITINFNNEESSRKQLLECIDQIVLEYNANNDKVVLAGFSQGANMATSLLLTAPNKVLAAGCFSGRLMEEIKPLIKRKDQLKSKQIFIGHGLEDNMLPIKYAEENKKILEENSISVSFNLYKMGHSISNEELEDFFVWLNEL